VELIGRIPLHTPKALRGIALLRERANHVSLKLSEITMKKLMLTIASLLFVSVMAVNAQVSSDTSSVSGQPPVSTEDQANYTRDMELIQSTDVPASLRSSLQGTEYTGWEEGKIYRNSTTNEYLVVIGDDDAKVYRFDANGTRIEDTPADANQGGSLNSGSGSTSDTTSTGSMGNDSSGSTGSGTTTDDSSTSGSTGSSSTSGSTGSGSTSGSTGTTGSGSTTTDK
jgi:hypothetical protein